MVIEVWSHVRHATEAIDEGQKANIEAAVHIQITRSLTYAIDTIVRKQFP